MAVDVSALMPATRQNRSLKTGDGGFSIYRVGIPRWLKTSEFDFASEFETSGLSSAPALYHADGVVDSLAAFVVEPSAQ
jgi:hypothetical protein